MTDSFQNFAITSLPDITKIEFIKINKNYLKVVLINFFIYFEPYFLCGSSLNLT